MIKKEVKQEDSTPTQAESFFFPFSPFRLMFCRCCLDVCVLEWGGEHHTHQDTITSGTTYPSELLTQDKYFFHFSVKKRINLNRC